MLTTRTHRPLAPTVSEQDGWTTVTFTDDIVREHTSGRYKGMIEHTNIHLAFPSREAAAEWLRTCLVGLEG